MPKRLTIIDLDVEYTTPNKYRVTSEAVMVETAAPPNKYRMSSLSLIVEYSGTITPGPDPTVSKFGPRLWVMG